MGKIIGFSGGLPFFFCIILVELFILKYIKKKDISLPLAFTNLQIGLGFFLFKLIFLGFYYYSYLFVYDFYHFFDFKSKYVDFALAVILYDLGFYWGHRLGHEVNLFWGGHVTHHQSEEYNLSVAYRLSWMGGPLVFFAFLPVALVGVSPKYFFVAAGINSFYQFFMHTSLLKKYPFRLDWLFVSPLFHSTHHGKNTLYVDKNYGSFFTIWDRIFGTYVNPDIEPIYGLPKPFTSLNSVSANFQYFGEIFSNIFNVNQKNRFKLLFGRPSFHAEMLKNDDVSETKFLSNGLFSYVILQTIIILVITSVYVHYFSEIKLWYNFLYLIWFTYSMFQLGRMLEGHLWHSIWECLRLLVLVGALFPIMDFMPSSNTTELYFGIFLVLFSIIHYLFVFKESKVSEVRYVP